MAILKRSRSPKGPPSDWPRVAREIGEAIESAALAPQNWSQVADKLRRVHSGLRVQFQVHDSALPFPMVLVQSGWSAHWLDVYTKHFASVNDVAKEWPRAPTMVPVLLPDAFLPVDRFIKTEFYNDGLRFEGEADAATGIKIFNENGRQAAISVQYAERHKGAMHEFLSPLLSAIAPQMRQALHLNRATARTLGPKPTASLVESLRDGALLVDGRGCVVASNRRADSMADDRQIRIGAYNTLSFGHPRTDARFRDALQSICDHNANRPRYHEIQHESEDGAFAITILPVSQNLRSFVLSGMEHLFAHFVLMLVILRDLNSDQNAKIERLKMHYGLTTAEAKVADALRCNGSVGAIADRLGIAYETARNQLKAAFAKTGTHSQRELLQLLLRNSDE